ncbi:putative peptidase S10, serine carboxypeptidase, alpha/Beta hydrolase [Helianthus anomalus]
MDTGSHMANMIYMDMPVGSGFSYAVTEEGWISSDTIFATQAHDFIKKVNVVLQLFIIYTYIYIYIYIKDDKKTLIS